MSYKVPLYLVYFVLRFWAFPREMDVAFPRKMIFDWVTQPYKKSFLTRVEFLGIITRAVCSCCCRTYMDEIFQAITRFQDSYHFQKATRKMLRCSLSVIFFTFQDSSFNPVPPIESIDMHWLVAHRTFFCVCVGGGVSSRALYTEPTTLRLRRVGRRLLWTLGFKPWTSWSWIQCLNHSVTPSCHLSVDHLNFQSSMMSLSALLAAVNTAVSVMSRRSCFQ